MKYLKFFKIILKFQIQIIKFQNNILVENQTMFKILLISGIAKDLAKPFPLCHLRITWDLGVKLQIIVHITINTKSVLTICNSLIKLTIKTCLRNHLTPIIQIIDLAHQIYLNLIISVKQADFLIKNLNKLIFINRT